MDESERRAGAGGDEREDEPCCLKLLRLLLELVNILLCLYALPAWGVLLLTRSIVLNSGYMSSSLRSNQLLYLFIGWVLRAAVVCVFIACLFGQVGGVTYALYNAGIASNAGQIAGFVIGQCVLIVFGVISLRRTTLNFFKIEVPLMEYGYGIVSSILDAFTFGAAVVSCAFVVRLYHIFTINRREGDPTIGYRSYVWRQVAMTVVDLLLLPFVGIIFVAHWRWSAARTEVDSLTGKEGEQRIAVLEHAMKVFLDLIPFAVGSLCFLTHRCMTLYRELKAADHIDKCRGIFLNQFLHLLIDIPFACLAVLLLPTFWRLISIARNWNHANNTAASRRRLVVAEFILALIDIPTLFAAAFVFVAYYRFERMKRKVAATPGFFAPFDASDQAGLCSHTLDAHAVVWRQFVGLAIDFPCAVAGFFVIITGWRTKEFIRDWNAVPAASVVTPRRILCWWHFGNLLIDIPFIFFSAGLTLIIYRAHTLWSRMYYCERANDRRWVALRQFVEFVVDLPFIVFGVVVCACVWRMPFFLRDIFANYSQLRAADRRRAVMQNLALAVLDVVCLPGAALMLVTAYRFPGLIDKLRNSRGLWHPLVIGDDRNGDEYEDRFGAHAIIMWEFIQLMADIPFAICGVICIGSLYRALPLRQALQATNGTANRRLACLSQFGSLLLDLPFIFIWACALLLGVTTCGVRTYLVLRDTFALSDAPARRLCACHHLMLAVLDALAIPCALFLTYRWPDAWRKLSTSGGFLQRYDPAAVGNRCCCCGEAAMRPHCIIFQSFGSLLLDLPFIPLGAMCLLTWRSPALYRELTEVGSRAASRRRASITHFFLLFVDILTLFPLVITFCSVIRTYYLVRRIGWACTRRFVVRRKQQPAAAPPVVSPAAAAAGAIATPPPAAVATPAPVAAAGGVSAAAAAAGAIVAPPVFVSAEEAKARDDEPEYESAVSLCCCGFRDIEFYDAVWSEFMNLLFDLPLLPFFLLNCVSLWRAPLMLYELSLVPASHDLTGSYNRGRCCGEFEFNCVRRKIVLKHALMLVADLFCLPLFAITFVGVWRFPIMCEKLRVLLSPPGCEPAKLPKVDTPAPAPTFAAADVDLENGTAGRRNSKSDSRNGRPGRNRKGGRRAAPPIPVNVPPSPLRPAAVELPQLSPSPAAAAPLLSPSGVHLSDAQNAGAGAGAAAAKPKIAPCEACGASAPAGTLPGTEWSCTRCTLMNNHRPSIVSAGPAGPGAGDGDATANGVAVPIAGPRAPPMLVPSPANGAGNGAVLNSGPVPSEPVNAAAAAGGAAGDDVKTPLVGVAPAAAAPIEPAKPGVFSDGFFGRYHDRLSDLSFAAHSIVVYEFGCTLLELPICIVVWILLCSWRTCTAISIIRDTANSDRRYNILIQALLIFLDIPCLLVAIGLFFTWRSLHFYRRLAKPDVKLFGSNPDTHKLVFDEAWQFIQDIPFAFCFVLVLPFVWRWPALYNIINSETSTDWEKRIAIAYQLYLAVLFDPLCIAFVALFLVFPWRIPALIHAWRVHFYQPPNPISVDDKTAKQPAAGIAIGAIKPGTIAASPAATPAAGADAKADAKHNERLLAAMDGKAAPDSVGEHEQLMADKSSQSRAANESFLRRRVGMEELQVVIFLHAAEGIKDIPFVAMGAAMVAGPPLLGLYETDNLHTYLTEKRGYSEVVVYIIEIAIALIVLIPYRGLLLVRDVLAHAETARERWRCVIVHIVMYPLDFFAVAIRLILLVTVYRAGRVSRRLETETRGFLRVYERESDEQRTISERLDCHKIVFAEFPGLLLDIPCAVMGLVVILTGWRTAHYYREMSATVESAAGADDIITQRRKLSVSHFLNLFLDIPFILCAVLVSCSVYRLWTVWSKISAEPVLNSRRIVAINQFGELLLDLPFILLGAIVTCCPHRIIYLWRDLLANYSTLTAADRRRAAAEQFGLAILDFPAFACLIILFISSYRYMRAVDDLREPNVYGFWSPFVKHPLPGSGTDRFNSHGVVFSHFFQLFLDVPCVVAGAVVFFTLWRTVPFVREFRAEQGADSINKRRIVCLSHFVSLIIDAPFIVLTLVLTCTVYRAHAVWSRIVEVDVNARRAVVARQIVELCCDLPFIAFGLCSGWRLPFLARDVFFVQFSAQQSGDRRRAATENFFLFLLDVPALLSFLLIAITGYRFWGVNGLWKELSDPNTVRPWAAFDRSGALNRFQTHGLLLYELFEWIVDIPFQALALVIMCTVWRAGTLFDRLFPTALDGWAAWCTACRRKSRAALDRAALAAERSVKSAGAGAAAAAAGANAAGVDEKHVVSINKPTEFNDIPKAVNQFVLWPYLDDRTMHGIARVSKTWRNHSRVEALKRPPALRVPLFNAPFVVPESFRRVVFQEFVEWLIDLPFVCLGLGLIVPLVVRIIPWIRDLTSHCDNAVDRRWATLQHVGMLALDALAVPCTVMLFVIAPYRLPNVWDCRAGICVPYGANNSYIRFNHYGVIFRNTLNAFVDLPCNFAGLLAACTLYRAYFMYCDTVTAVPRRRYRYGEHRLVCLYHAAMIIPDIVCAFLAVPVVGTIWRTPTLFANHKRGKSFHRNILHCLWLIFVDLMCIFPVLMIFIGIQRVLSFCRKSSRITTLYDQIVAEREEARKKALADRPPRAAAAGADVAAVTPVVAAAPAGSNAALAAVAAAAPLVAPLRVDEPFIALLPPPAPRAGEVSPNADARHGAGRTPSVAGGDMKAGDAEKAAAAAAEAAEKERKLTNRTRRLLNAAIRSLREEDGLPTVAPADLSACAMEYPLSLSFYRPIILAEAKFSFLQFYHVLLFPVRVLGFLFVPIHHYVEWRLGSPVATYVDPTDAQADLLGGGEGADGAPFQADAEIADPSAPGAAAGRVDGGQQIRQPITLSFLFLGLIWLQKLATDYKEFKSLEKFLVVNLLTIPLLVLNEFGVLWMAVRAAMMIGMSFGIRANVHDPVSGYKPSACERFFGYLSFFIQGLWLPLWALLEFAFLFSPIFIASGQVPDMFAGNVPVVAIFQNSNSHLYVWAIWVLFAATNAGSVQLSWRFAHYIAHLYRPWMFWSELMALHAYGWMLGSAVRSCYSTAKTCGCMGKLIGEGGLAVVSFVWIMWPTIFPIALKSYPYLGLTIPFNIVFLYFAVKIIRANWSKNAEAEHNRSMEEAEAARAQKRREKEVAEANKRREKLAERKRIRDAERAERQRKEFQENGNENEPGSEDAKQSVVVGTRAAAAARGGRGRPPSAGSNAAGEGQRQPEIPLAVLDYNSVSAARAAGDHKSGGEGSAAAVSAFDSSVVDVPARPPALLHVQSGSDDAPGLIRSPVRPPAPAAVSASSKPVRCKTCDSPAPASVAAGDQFTCTVCTVINNPRGGSISIPSPAAAAAAASIPVAIPVASASALSVRPPAIPVASNPNARVGSRAATTQAVQAIAAGHWDQSGRWISNAAGAAAAANGGGAVAVAIPVRPAIPAIAVPALKPVAAAAAAAWSCRTCTYENGPTRMVCEMCNADKP